MNSLNSIKKHSSFLIKPSKGLIPSPGVANTRIRYYPGAERFFPLFGNVLSTEMCSYRWESEDCLKAALFFLQGIMLARQTGIKKQEDLYIKEIQLLFGNDKCLKAVTTLKKHGYRAKPFSFSPDIKKGENHLVKGKKHDWLLVDIEKSDKAIPIKALRELQILKKNGLQPQDIRVAYALKPEKSNAEIIKDILAGQALKALAIMALPLGFLSDPVLCVSFGEGFYAEIDRWGD